MTETITEYRIGERSVLRPGTQFRATGGPVYETVEGDQIPIAAKGPFVFRCLHRMQSCLLIEAFDKYGNAAVLHIEGKRTPPFPGFVARPYKIRSLIRRKKHDRRRK